MFSENLRTFSLPDSQKLQVKGHPKAVIVWYAGTPAMSKLYLSIRDRGRDGAGNSFNFKELSMSTIDFFVLRI